MNVKVNNSDSEEDEVIKYFENAQKVNTVYIPIYKYFKYLYFRGIGKRTYKEIMILHFPILSFIVFLII